MSLAPAVISREGAGHDIEKTYDHIAQVAWNNSNKLIPQVSNRMIKREYNKVYDYCKIMVATHWDDILEIADDLRKGNFDKYITKREPLEEEKAKKKK